MNKRVSYGWAKEDINEKIGSMRRLSLAERLRQGLATGDLARQMAQNQARIYGKGYFKSIQVLKLKDRSQKRQRDA